MSYCTVFYTYNEHIILELYFSLFYSVELCDVYRYKCCELLTRMAMKSSDSDSDTTAWMTSRFLLLS